MTSVTITIHDATGVLFEELPATRPIDDTTSLINPS